MNTTTETVTVKRCGTNIVEYTIAGIWTFHATRYATFHGEYTGRGDARQVSGAAKTLWRSDDNEMRAAFKRKFPNADLQFTL